MEEYLCRKLNNLHIGHGDKWRYESNFGSFEFVFINNCKIKQIDLCHKEEKYIIANKISKPSKRNNTCTNGNSLSVSRLNPELVKQKQRRNHWLLSQSAPRTSTTAMSIASGYYGEIPPKHSYYKSQNYDYQSRINEKCSKPKSKISNQVSVQSTPFSLLLLCIFIMYYVNFIFR